MGVEVPQQTKAKLPPLVAVGRKLGEIITKPFGYKPYFDFEGLRKITVDQISASKRYVQIIEGRFNAQVYNNDEVISALEKAVERGVKIELASGPDPDPESSRLWAMVNGGDIDYYQLRIPPETHSTVVDSGHVRVEYPHGPWETSRNGYASIATDKNSLAFNLLRNFDEIRSGATKVERVVVAQP